VDGGVVVERLDGELVLVLDGGVVDADEAVGRARDEQRGLGRVEGEGGDVVAVDFGVGRFWGWVGADVPERGGKEEERLVLEGMRVGERLGWGVCLTRGVL
jgi:hypothetical protein